MLAMKRNALPGGLYKRRGTTETRNLKWRASMKRTMILSAVLSLALPTAAWSDGDAQPPEVSLDGLEQIEKTRRKEVYRAPGVDWSVYEAIQLETATVAFRKNWLRDQNRTNPFRIREQDVNRIREETSKLFGEVFSKELTDKGGYTLVDQADENVLQIVPYIVDLDVYAPDPRYQAGIQRSYVESAGRMTLKLHLYDSVTGDLLAVFSERRDAPYRGYMQWANSVSNTREFRLIMESWARELREGLQEAQFATTPQ